MAALAVRARALLAEQPQTHGLLVRRHGMYTWGKDLATAARHVEILEFLMEAVGRRQMMEPT
jgi:methylthioribulose-1-phosphate dehydratase